jgi:hypothetical protein
MQGADRSFVPVLGVSASKSSLMGNESWGATSMINLDFKQLSLTGKYTKMYAVDGKISYVRNFSLTYATTWSSHLGFLGYTYIKLLSNKGVMGYNASAIAAFIGPGMTMFAPSLTGFYMRPLETKTKVKFTPEIFLMGSPISYMTSDPIMKVNKNFNVMLGNSFDIPLSKRFRVNFNVKTNLSSDLTIPTFFFTIGSKFNL